MTSKLFRSYDRVARDVCYGLKYTHLKCKDRTNNSSVYSAITPDDKKVCLKITLRDDMTDVILKNRYWLYKTNYHQPTKVSRGPSHIRTHTFVRSTRDGGPTDCFIPTEMSVNNIWRLREDGDTLPVELMIPSVHVVNTDFFASVTPWCDDGDLTNTVLVNEYIPDFAKIRRYTEQIIESMRVLYDVGIIHGDIKLENIISFPNRVRLIDLGNSTKTDTPEDLLEVTTPTIIPPDYFTNSLTSTMSDVWALGTCVYYLLSGKLFAKWDKHYPFDIENRTPDRLWCMYSHRYGIKWKKCFNGICDSKQLCPTCPCSQEDSDMPPQWYLDLAAEFNVGTTDSPDLKYIFRFLRNALRFKTSSRRLTTIQ